MLSGAHEQPTLHGLLADAIEPRILFSISQYLISNIHHDQCWHGLYVCTSLSTIIDNDTSNHFAGHSSNWVAIYARYLCM